MVNYYVQYTLTLPKLIYAVLQECFLYYFQSFPKRTIKINNIKKNQNEKNIHSVRLDGEELQGVVMKTFEVL